MSPHHSHKSPVQDSPHLEWVEGDTPFSSRFGDIYYSRGGGLAESEHVFLRQNRLATRWAELADSPAQPFVIGETGFGTGLNFLLAWQLWRSSAPRSARLVFRSLEAYPLTAAMLRRALAPWGALRTEAEALIADWPPRIKGLHTLEFDAGRVCLQLYFGDVIEALDQFTPSPADAWFLDGFAPARNPLMWSPEVMRRIAMLSRPGTTLATFTVAGSVRRALTQAGFTLERARGHGSKREILSGILTEVQPQPAPLTETPWHIATHAPRERRALIIGAGIAGCCTAYALARRGWQVNVFESESDIALQGSGNPQAVLYTQLPRTDSAGTEFGLHSFLYALRFYSAVFPAAAEVFSACGMLQLVDAHRSDALDRLRARFAGLPELVRFVDQDEASQLCGMRAANGGWYLPRAGWIAPRRICRFLLDHPSISTRTQHDVVAIEGDATGWTVRTRQGADEQAPVVVLANGMAAAQLSPSRLPLRAVRGQITGLSADQIAAQPRCVVCADGYVTPELDGRVYCGATFVRNDEDLNAREVEDQHNLEQLRQMLPDYDWPTLHAAIAESRVALRCTTPDRLPIVGPLPIDAAMRERFAALATNARQHVAEFGAYADGLYATLAHGSRGMTSAPLCAEALAALINDEPSPLPARLQRALSPGRFVIRDLIKGRP